MAEEKKKLDPIALGLAAGIVWGVSLFLATFWILYVMRGTGQNLALLGRFYLGYTPTPLGAFIGLVWGFIDFFIVGVIFAALYNLLARAK